MTAEQSTGLSPWDLSPPRRPTLADYNQASLQNDPQDPPALDGTMVTANLLNGQALTQLGMGQIVANAKLSVIFVAAAPVLETGVTIAGVSPGVASPVAAGNINVLRTPGGAGSGDVFLWWPASTFPAATVGPTAGLNGATPGNIAADLYTDVGTGHSGIRVVTLSVGGAATDMAFTVDVP